MKSVVLAALAGMFVLTSPAEAAVTYTFTSTANPGFAATSFVLTTPQYITSTTTFSASAFTSCSVGGGATPLACTSAQFVPNGTPYDTNSYLVLNTAGGSKLVQFVWAGLFASNSSHVMFGGLPNEGFSQFTITGSADATPVPEPASWGMMILGLGMVGATIRRRRSRTIAFA